MINAKEINLIGSTKPEKTYRHEKITYNVQYVNWNAHLNLMKGIFSNKPSIAAEKESSKCADIQSDPEICQGRF